MASPPFDEAIEHWLSDPESERASGIERALLRYFVRMTARPTPFGLSASCSVGLRGDKTFLLLGERRKYRRHTYLATKYLFALTDTLRGDPALRTAFLYRPNSSLYRSAGRVRYVAWRPTEKELSYHLVSAEETEALLSSLACAEAGATFDSLVEGLVSEEVTQNEAEAYIAELTESQILLADIPLTVSGREPVDSLVEGLRQSPLTNQIAESLGEAQRALAGLDHAGLGVEPRRYQAVARLLEALPGEMDANHLFQAELIKPMVRATISDAVVAEVARGVQLLHRLQARPRDEELRRFRERFEQRYELREIPLLQALDEEEGIGFESSRDVSPLLKGENVSPGEGEVAPWGARENFLLEKLGETLRRANREMVLTREDEVAIGPKDSAPLPDAFAAVVTLAAATESDLDRGNFRLVLHNVFGPSGARWLGRFCYSAPELVPLVERHLRAEEALQPEAIFAEIVHLPGRHFGFLCRPSLRDHEIPYLGYSGLPAAQQIPATDLTVSVRRERVVLRSTRLGREIIPRLTSAHNHGQSSLGVYKFLCALMEQDQSSQLGWDWGVLKAAEFLPRVTSGRFILSLARWRVSLKELKRFREPNGAALFQTIQAWRRERQLPRWVAVADADNVLPIDLDNVLSVEMFVHLVRHREEATLIEVFPGPGELCVHGPEGSFVHELIVPFVRANQKESIPVPTKASPVPVEAIRRSFPPGSEWLFAKLYLGDAAADDVLLQTVAPLVREVGASGAAEQWFFIRYADPDPHLRLRFRGRPERLHGEVLPALQKALSPLADNGPVWRWQLDTYERELERYGGPEGMLIAERFFQVDSEAVLEILALLEYGDAGLDERWRLALRGIDFLLSDFGLDLTSKCAFFKEMPKYFVEMSRVDHAMRVELGEKFRRERASLEEILDPACDAGSPLALGFEVLRRRSAQMAPIMADLRASMEAGRFLVSLDSFIASFLHMQVNRLLRSSHRRQELVIYELLSRLYQSLNARGRDHP